MTKTILFFLLCSLLSVTTLQAQTFSRIELINTLQLTADYDYVTTWSDSLLHFYTIDNTANTFVLKHWTCSSDGVLTSPIGMYAYSSVESWGTTFPTYRTYWKQYGCIYISFVVLSHTHILSITESGSVTHDILPSGDYYRYHLFTPDYLYYSETTGHYPDLICSIYRYDLNTNSSDSLFVIPYHSPVLNVIDNRYLLITPMMGNSLENCILLDTLHVAHPSSITGTSFIWQMSTTSPEILPDTYFAAIEDGLLRDYQFCVLTVNNYNLNISVLGGVTYCGGGLYGTNFFDIIAYNNGRFSCIEGFSTLTYLTYRNFIYDGINFTSDDNFPNLQPYPNPYSLQRINDRYAVAIAGPQTGPRNFICIDYQNQSVTDSVFTFTNAPNINYAELYSDNDNLFYLYQTVQGMYLYILKIVEYTANADPVQTPQVMSCTAYPNPFIDNTTIKVSLKQPEPLTVIIYNLKGQLVRTLTSQSKAELNHELDWDGKADIGNSSAPGLYVYKASTLSGKSISGKIILLK
ncbi:MAG: T9SS type A sorting domain-containing protein [Bacteroidales bacterium]|nr:T9SS type A sorting domain-containing protein [Bacteroidales bacterium]